MFTFGQGNNKEYYVEVITVKQLLEQKGTIKDAKKAFEMVLTVKKLQKPLSAMTRDGETCSEKEEPKLQKPFLKQDLHNAKELAEAETMKAYKLFPCFAVREVKTQWDKIVQEMHTCNHLIGVNGRGSRSIFLPDLKISAGNTGHVRQKKVYLTQISHQHKNPQC
jgi:hypothetical protein